jgi:hypothetical protein
MQFESFNWASALRPLSRTGRPLRGVEHVASVTGGIAEQESLGTRILPAQDDRNVGVHL